MWGQPGRPAVGPVYPTRRDVIAPVALSADALSENCDCQGVRLIELHRRLTEMLLAHGQLVFADDNAAAYFLQQVRELGARAPSAGKLWEGLLQYGRTALASPPYPTPIERTTDLVCLASNWSPLVKLALMEPVRVQLIGDEDADAVYVDSRSGLEIGAHDCAEATRTFSALRALDARRSVRKHADRDRVWDARFAPIVRIARRIHIQDRFMGRRLDAHYKWCRVNGRHGAEQEVEWLLRRIGQDAVDGAVLTFYTEVPGNWTPHLIPDAFTNAVRRASVRDALAGVQLYAVPENRWEPHDRHLRADDIGIELSSGFDRLGMQRATRGYSLTYMYTTPDVQKLKDEENSVRNAHGQPPIQIVA